MGKRLYKFTDDKKKNLFLGNLIKAAGNIGRAAEATGITRQTHYNWLREDDSYAVAYNGPVKEMCLNALEDEASRRAVQGFEEPVFFRGKVVGYVTKYSDRLLELLLKANAPEKYRERVENKVVGEGEARLMWKGEGDE